MNGAAWLPEFDMEMANTRKILERVPEAHADYRPHPKSYTMSELAAHLAWVPHWMKPTLEMEVLDMGGMAGPKAMKSNVELLAFFDAGIAAARPALEAASAECMSGMWSLASNGQTHFTMPRFAVVRSFIMNHAIHHRGQLEVYLRINDVPLPALYGPSADEGKM